MIHRVKKVQATPPIAHTAQPQAPNQLDASGCSSQPIFHAADSAVTVAPSSQADQPETATPN